MLKDLHCKNAKGREKPYKLADSHGLYLYVTPKGHRSWRWNYRFKGKSGTRVLGTYPEMSLANAKIARAKLDELRRAGTDPAEASQRIRNAEASEEEAKFEAVARRWHEQRSHVLSPTHRSNIIKWLEADIFPHFGDTHVGQITPKMVLTALRPIEERSADRAHRMRRFISAVFECAIADELAAHDPAARLGALLKPKVSRNRPALRTIEDAQALLRAAEAAPAHPLTKLASRMLAVTAVRSYPLRHAEPHEFEGLDGDNPIWRIPPTKMKLDVTQKQQEAFEFIVPLPPQAVEIIKVARQLASGKYVFPNVRYPNKPMSENAISVMYRRLPRFSGRHVPHGWRSTFSTIMNERAEERDRPNDRNVIDLMLAHKPAGVEAVYNRANFMARRRKIAEEWAELLFGSLPPATTLLEGPRR